MSSKTAWFIYRVPGQQGIHSKTLSLKNSFHDKQNKGIITTKPALWKIFEKKKKYIHAGRHMKMTKQ